MEVAIMKKPKEVNYVKPNMGALHGKVGLSIIETILNTPRPDDTELEKECERLEERMLATQRNGSN